MKLNQLFVGLAITALVLMPMVAGAQVTTQGPPQDIEGVGRILCDIFGWAFTFFIIAAIFYVLFAGWKYLTAGGDEEKVKEANKTLIYAVVAIIIAILANSVPSIAASLLNLQLFGGAC